MEKSYVVSEEKKFHLSISELEELILDALNVSGTLKSSYFEFSLGEEAVDVSQLSITINK